MLGIDKVKKVIKNGVDIIIQVRKAKSDDGKISKAEWFGFIDEGVALLGNVANLDTIIAQCKDIDKNEAKELIQYTISLGAVEGDAVIIVVNVVEALEKGLAIYEENIKPIIAVFNKGE